MLPGVVVVAGLGRLCWGFTISPECRQEVEQRAWCGGQADWLEVVLDRDHVLTGLEVEGGPGALVLQWWRAGSGWTEYRSANTGPALPSPVTVLDGQLVLGSRVRLSPHTTTARPACLRLRLLGCPYSGNFFSSLLSALTGPGGSSRLSGAAAPHLHP